MNGLDRGSFAKNARDVIEPELRLHILKRSVYALVENIGIEEVRAEWKPFGVQVIRIQGTRTKVNLFMQLLDQQIRGLGIEVYIIPYKGRIGKWLLKKDLKELQKVE